jgi:hypothetical protein
MKKIIPVLIALVAITMTAAACQPGSAGQSSVDRPPSGGARVLVLGDSLTAEAWKSGRPELTLKSWKMDWAGSKFGSTACDGYAVARSVPLPDVVIVSYSGNAGLYSCVTKGNTLSEKYQYDLNRIIDFYKGKGVRIVVVGAPKRATEGTEAVYKAMKSTAAARGVPWMDGGNTITPNRAATVPRTATCLAGEPSCRSNGTNIIRNADLTHFCPTDVDFYGRCGTYSSGAYRFNLALNHAVTISKAVK